MLPSLPADRHDGHHGDDYGENECSEQDQLDRDGDVAIDVNHLPVRVIAWCVSEREIRRDLRRRRDVHLNLGHVPAMVSGQLM